MTRRDRLMFVLCLVAALACATAFLAQFAASSFFLLEMIVSLSAQIFVCSALVSLAAFFWHKRLAAGLAALTIIAGQPLLFFSNFGTPTDAECGADDCFKILTINLWGDSEILPALSELIAEYEVDIVAINEASRDTIDPQFEDVYFSDYETVIHAMWLNMPRGMGNPISLLSREPIADFERVLNRDTGGRAYIAADLGGDWTGIRIVMAHAQTPISPSGLSRRNALIDDISQVAEESESFVLLGDFNMTPWSPKFSTLPGRRAGDPRFSMTWPTLLPLLGMPIDHIMYSDDLELVEFEILRSIGSDHYPVMAVFKRKDR